MAELSDNTNWFETDAANSTATPNGWPEGQMPSTVNDCARAMMGGLKRFWNRVNPVTLLSPTGAAWQLNTSNTTFPTAYVQGEVISFRASGNSVGNDTLQINSLGAKPIYKRTWTTPSSRLVAYDIVGGGPAAQFTYDSTLNGGAGGFWLLNPWLPILNDGSGGINVENNALIGGSLTVTGSITGGSIAGYLPLSGGTLTGNLTINPGTFSVSGGASFGASITVTNNATVGATGISYSGIGSTGSGHNFAIGWDGSFNHIWVDGADKGNVATTTWAIGNFLSLGGGTLSGPLAVTGNLGATLTMTANAVVASTQLTVNGIVLSNNSGNLQSGNPVYVSGSGGFSCFNGGSDYCHISATGSGNPSNYLVGSSGNTNGPVLEVNSIAGWGSTDLFLCALTGSRRAGVNSLGTSFGWGPFVDISSFADMKSDIGLIADPVAAIRRLRPHRYFHDSLDRYQCGFVIEELAQDFPDAVAPGLDGKPEGYTATTLIAPLVAAVQELARRIEALEK